MLIDRYQIEVTSPPCEPGSERWSAFARLESDLAEVLPYLNAVWPNAVYDHNARILTRRSGNHGIAVRPNEVAVSNALDRRDAERLLADLIAEINQVWARRERIVPQSETRRRPTAMAIYRLLPRTNCKACGHATCWAFALQLVAGQAGASDCALLQAQDDARRVLEELLGTPRTHT